MSRNLIESYNHMKQNETRYSSQYQMKVQSSSSSYQLQITLHLEQCSVRADSPQRLHPFSV